MTILPSMVSRIWTLRTEEAFVGGSNAPTEEAFLAFLQAKHAFGPLARHEVDTVVWAAVPNAKEAEAFLLGGDYPLNDASRSTLAPAPGFVYAAVRSRVQVA